MTCNDVLIRLRYMFDYSDAEMVTVFAAAEHATTKDQVKKWLEGEDSPLHEPLGDPELAAFLNGLINHRRGKRPGPQPAPETSLNNNIIANKLKIALNLKGDDMIRLLALADFNLSNHELSAFFRRPGHKNFREMNNQILRYFLKGLQVELRP
ncbi:MAG: hypothetical protein ACI9W4_002701 [Rhodothermales bacterium]|jgi:uncharacterized protein YehS (DUF1456 family)